MRGIDPGRARVSLPLKTGIASRMDKSVGHKSELDGIRQEIDDLDAKIVDLLVARFAATNRVREAKSNGPQSGSMPYRPGREAIILRRLIEQADGQVPQGLIERVWRTIITSSVLSQATVRVVTIGEVLADARYRAAIELFASMMPVEKVGSLKAALDILSGGDPVLVVLPTKVDWTRILQKAPEGAGARVVSLLSASSNKPSRSLVVLGRAVSEPTGEDETLLVTTGKLPRDFVPKPVWHLKLSDEYHLTALPGYLTTSEQPLVSLKANTALALKVAGRYPSPMEFEEE